MVGYNPLAEGHLSHSQHAAAGALSGATSRALCQPIDVIKIRFQLQVEPIKVQDTSNYQSLLQAAKKIRNEEGFRAFWKGHVPAQALSVGFGLTQYTSFEVLTYLVWKTMPERLTTTHRSLTHTVCGALSGCVATAIIHPLDVIRTRFVAQGEPKVYKNMMSAVMDIFKRDGVVGFYRGIFPAIAVVGPQMGLQFGFYAFFTSLWHNESLSKSLPGSIESFICGFGSGFISKSVVHPFDVIKKRLQIQGFEKARIQFGAVRVYHNAWHCFIQSFREEGLRGLYKGLTPSIIKSSLVAGTHLLAYEQICKGFLYYNHGYLGR